MADPLRESIAAAGGSLQRHKLHQAPEDGPKQGDPRGSAATGSGVVGHGNPGQGVAEALRSVAGRRRFVRTFNPRRPDSSLRMAEPRNDS